MLYAYNSSDDKYYSKSDLLRLYRYYIGIMVSRHGSTVSKKVNRSDKKFVITVIKHASLRTDLADHQLYLKFETICNLLSEFPELTTQVEQLWESIKTLNYVI